MRATNMSVQIPGTRCLGPLAKALKLEPFAPSTARARDNGGAAHIVSDRAPGQISVLSLDTVELSIIFALDLPQQSASWGAQFSPPNTSSLKPVSSRSRIPLNS